MVIAAAAVKLPAKEGCYWVGRSHYEARGRARECGIEVERNDFEHGFVDLNGQWLTREEAYAIAKANGQMKFDSGDYGPGRLDSTSTDITEENLNQAIKLQIQNNSKYGS